MYKTILLKELKILDDQLKSILNRLGEFPTEIIKKRISNSWSIEEHLYHCYLVEKLSLSYVQKKTLYPQKLVSPGITTCVRFYFLKLILVFKVKLKAPKVVSSFPDSIAIDQLYFEWIEIRSSLSQIIQSLPEEVLRKGVFKHPVIGRLSMALTLKFFKFHLNHHLYTVNNILSASLKK